LRAFRVVVETGFLPVTNPPPAMMWHVTATWEEGSTCWRFTAGVLFTLLADSFDSGADNFDSGAGAGAGAGAGSAGLVDRACGEPGFVDVCICFFLLLALWRRRLLLLLLLLLVVDDTAAAAAVPLLLVAGDR
jgi:hypothetical protein